MLLAMPVIVVGVQGTAGAAQGGEGNVCNGIWTAAGDAQQRRQAKQAVTGRCVGEGLTDQA
jgi:hypothetical protein